MQIIPTRGLRKQDGDYKRTDDLDSSDNAEESSKSGSFRSSEIDDDTNTVSDDSSLTLVALKSDNVQTAKSAKTVSADSLTC